MHDLDSSCHVSGFLFFRSFLFHVVLRAPCVYVCREFGSCGRQLHSDILERYIYGSSAHSTFTPYVQSEYFFRCWLACLICTGHGMCTLVFRINAQATHRTEDYYYYYYYCLLLLPSCVLLPMSFEKLSRKTGDAVGKDRYVREIIMFDFVVRHPHMLPLSLLFHFFLVANFNSVNFTENPISTYLCSSYSFHETKLIFCTGIGGENPINPSKIRLYDWIFSYLQVLNWRHSKTYSVMNLFRIQSQ